LEDKEQLLTRGKRGFQTLKVSRVTLHRYIKTGERDQ
jgi:hypothetical protein